MGIYKIKPNARKYSRVANNEFEFCKFTGLKTISYCQNSDMRIIVNQTLSVESLWSSLQDEVYFMAAGAARGPVTSPTMVAILDFTKN